MATVTSLQIGWRQLKLCVNAPYQLPPPPTGTQFVTIWTYGTGAFESDDQFQERMSVSIVPL